MDCARTEALWRLDVWIKRYGTETSSVCGIRPECLWFHACSIAYIVPKKVSIAWVWVQRNPKASPLSSLRSFDELARASAGTVADRELSWRPGFLVSTARRNIWWIRSGSWTRAVRTAYLVVAFAREPRARLDTFVTWLFFSYCTCTRAKCEFWGSFVSARPILYSIWTALTSFAPIIGPILTAFQSTAMARLWAPSETSQGYYK
jgi:hypothetical protein